MGLETCNSVLAGQWKLVAAVGMDREQQSTFLKSFANGRNVVAQGAVFEFKQSVRFNFFPRSFVPLARFA